MGLTAKFTAAIYARLTGSPDFGNSRFEYPGQAGVDISNGTGDNQADLLFVDTRTIAASSNDDLDLAGGSLSDPLGNALTFATVKAILVKAAAGNTNDVVVGGEDSAAFVGPFGGTDETISIPPGGSCLLTAPVDGWAVTATAADILRIANSAGGTGVDYDIMIVGTSA